MQRPYKVIGDLQKTLTEQYETVGGRAAVIEQNHVQIYIVCGDRIYAAIFNQDWVAQELAKLDCFQSG